MDSVNLPDDAAFPDETDQRLFPIVQGMIRSVADAIEEPDKLSVAELDLLGGTLLTCAMYLRGMAMGLRVKERAEKAARARTDNGHRP